MADFRSDQQKKDKKIASSVSQSQNVSHSLKILVSKKVSSSVSQSSPLTWHSFSRMKCTNMLSSFVVCLEGITLVRVSFKGVH